MVAVMGSTWLLLDIRGRYGVSMAVSVTGCGWPLYGLRGCYGLYRHPAFFSREDRNAWLLRDRFMCRYVTYMYEQRKTNLGNQNFRRRITT